MKKYLLPILAGVLVVVAVVVILAVPKGGTTENYAGRNDAGDVVIRAETLSETTVTFLRLSKDSRVELLARKGADGKAKVALATCQSCNGSPGAYYTQVGDQLQCNNCKLTFPLNVIDMPGGGCHPITIDAAAVSYTGNDVVLNAELLAGYESLFAKVAKH